MLLCSGRIIGSAHVGVRVVHTVITTFLCLVHYFRIMSRVTLFGSLADFGRLHFVPSFSSNYAGNRSCMQRRGLGTKAWEGLNRPACT